MNGRDGKADSRRFGGLCCDIGATGRVALQNAAAARNRAFQGIPPFCQLWHDGQVAADGVTRLTALAIMRARPDLHLVLTGEVDGQLSFW
jgi:hypothetical protein